MPVDPKAEIEIIPVKRMDEVLALALTELPSALRKDGPQVPIPTAVEGTGGPSAPTPAA